MERHTAGVVQGEEQNKCLLRHMVGVGCKGVAHTEPAV